MIGGPRRPVGRDAEVLAVSVFLACAERGPTGLLVEGEPGIGKTTLLLDATDRAVAQGFQVLSASGSPAEVSYAYAAVADLLSGVDEAALARLPDVQRLALTGVQCGDVDDGQGAGERMVATAFLALIEQLSAQAPVLLMIDDAHWLDASSKAVIGFTARRLRGRAGMLTTVRTGDPASSQMRSQFQFRRPETLTRVSVRPLTLGGLHALIAARLGHTLPRPTIARIHDISGGNPFFALELAARADAGAAGGVADLPDSLATLVRRRIGDVDDDVAAALLAAASTPAPTVELIAQGTDFTVARVVDLLDSVESRAIINRDGNRVRFTHPLFATGVYTGATSSRRRAMHRRFADLIDQPEIRARHLALSAVRGDPATLSALDAAAESTFNHSAPAAAAELIELAIALEGDTPARRFRAAELHYRAGSLNSARQHLQACIDNAPPGATRCMALLMQVTVLGYHDDIVGAAAAMTRAGQEAGDDPTLQLLCLLRRVMGLAMVNQLDDAVDRAEAAVELAHSIGVPGLRSQALSILVYCKFIRGLGVDHDALQLALELEDPNDGATTWFRASSGAAIAPAHTGDIGRARTQLRAVQQQLQASGTEVDMLWAAARLATIALWSGNFPEAVAAAQDAIERAEQMGARLALTTAWSVQASVAAYTGREADARTAAEAAIDMAHQIGAVLMVKDPTTALGFLAVSREDYAAAVAVLQPLLDGFSTAPCCDMQHGAYLPDAIEALTALGRVDEAESLVIALERDGAVHDWPWTLAVAARGRAHALAARGEVAAAQEAIELAMTHHERLPMPFETARTQLLLGQIRRRRRHADATAKLRDALATFERLGAPLWAARARAELGQLDGGATTVLTGSEQRLADLAAKGMSNKEIAAQLFVSTKTVEMNLSRVYRKLDIRSRAELSAALAINQH